MSLQTSLMLPGGAKIPAVGLGTWEAKNETELTTALEKAIELGYRHIDTAYIYENEHIIGKVLKKLFAAGKIKREEIFITTKLPGTAIRADRVETFLKVSLENLGLDYVDLYLIHFPICLKRENGIFMADEPIDHVAVWKKMEEQVEAGRTKFIGLSNFNKRQIEKLLSSSPKIKPANLQVELHVFMQQKGLVQYCHDNDITVTAFSPLGSPGYNKFLSTLGEKPKDLPDMLRNKTIKKIADNHRKTNAQIMLRFLIQKNIIVIPKSVNLCRLRENIDVFDFEITKDEMKVLEALDSGEAARVCDMRFLRLENHEEWPFEICD